MLPRLHDSQKGMFPEIRSALSSVKGIGLPDPVQ
jgi:hypothetical protein